MNPPVEHGIALAGVLLVLGLTGLLVRRDLLFMLFSIEVMLNAAGLAFVVAGSRWGSADGQVMFIFILSMAAAEVSVGLAIALRFFRRYETLDMNLATELNG